MSSVQPSSPHRSRWRLHAFTWCVLALATIILVLLIVPGELVDATPSPNAFALYISYLSSATPLPTPYIEDTREHGWPWAHTTRRSRLPVPNTATASLLFGHRAMKYGTDSFDWASAEAWKYGEGERESDLTYVIYDLLAALGVLGIVALASEWWLRRRRRWWQFSIRELLLATALTACVLGWWRSQALEVAQEQVVLDSWPKGKQPRLDSEFEAERTYEGPLWLRRLVGADNLPWLCKVHTLTYNLCPTEDSGLDEAVAIRAVESLNQTLRELPHVKTVRSSGSPTIVANPRLIVFPPTAEVLVTKGNDGMACASQMPYLKHLRYEKGHDLGLACLQNHVALETLYLSGDGITDACVHFVAQIKPLKELTLSHTRVTEAGLAELRELSPNLVVILVKDASD